MLEIFCDNSYGMQVANFIIGSSIIDVWQGAKYAFDIISMTLPLTKY